MIFGNNKQLREAQERIRELEIQVSNLVLANRQLEERSNELERRYSTLLEVDSYLENRQREADETEKLIADLRGRYQKVYEIFSALENEISLYRDDLELGAVGLYRPTFNFDSSAQYKEAVERNFEEQKKWIKGGRAVVCQLEWSIGGSREEGRKMTERFKSLMLLAFNGECDSLIAKIKWNNAEKTRERIKKVFDQINKLGESTTISITGGFRDLKLQEMALTHEYELKKYEEKETQRVLREQLREEEKAQREFERAQREAEDEERRFEKALEKARAEVGKSGEQSVELAERIRQLENQLRAAHERKERALAMAQLTKAGHIYVVSNIGAFGEDVYKIGMTRRLDPLERVRELGDASVPFQFDVHAIIYSENAPQLEAELHQRFSSQRINLINQRKEFFKVALSEIEEFIKSRGNAEIEFTTTAEAREYRETLSFLERQVESSETVSHSRFPSKLPE